MNAIRNMLEIRFPNIYILSRIIYYILPLTIVIALAIKVLILSKVRKTLSNIFGMHYGNIKYQTCFFFISDCKMYYFMVEEMNRRTQKHDFTSKTCLKNFPT